MLKPRALTPGDRLAVLAPASAFPKEEFDEGIAELERLGFVPVYDDSVFARRHYLAGPAELRAEALRRAWDKVHAENVTRDAIRQGMLSADAYAKYGIL